MRYTALIVLILLHAVCAYAEEVWLVIGASDPTPEGIAKKWKRCGTSSGITVQSSDCGDSKNVFAWVPKIETSAEAARQSLKAVKSSLQDAYIKRCRIRPDSLLSFRENAVDLSIADVPSTAVTWDYADRVTTVQPLSGPWHIIISRYYDGSSIEDPLEGRRERVILVGKERARHTLEPCMTPENFAVGEGTFAYQCTVGQAGDELLHKVVVYTMAGGKSREVMHCRNPQFPNGKTVACEIEEVNAEGILRLQRIERAL
jgi:hypothetical protein